MRSHCESILQSIEGISDDIHKRAFELRDYYLETWHAEHDTRKTDEIANKPKFYLYVEKGVTVPQIRWSKIEYKKVGNKWRRWDQPVSRGNGVKYSMSKFKSAPEWQREAIREMEDKFADIRSIGEKISGVSKTIKGLMRIHALEEKDHERSTD